MAAFVSMSSSSFSLPLSSSTKLSTICCIRHMNTLAAIRLSRGGLTSRRKTRGSTLVTRAGPSASNYLLAFAIPFTLLAGTIFTSIKIADKLDRDYLEEVALNEAIREAEGKGEDNDNAELSSEEVIQEPLPSRRRNRPKREV